MKNEKVQVVSGVGYSYIVRFSKEKTQSIIDGINQKVEDIMNTVYQSLTGADRYEMRAILERGAWEQVSEVSCGLIVKLNNK